MALAQMWLTHKGMKSICALEPWLPQEQAQARQPEGKRSLGKETKQANWELASLPLTQLMNARILVRFSQDRSRTGAPNSNTHMIWEQQAGVGLSALEVRFLTEAAAITHLPTSDIWGCGDPAWLPFPVFAKDSPDIGIIIKSLHF